MRIAATIELHPYVGTTLGLPKPSAGRQIQAGGPGSGCNPAVGDCGRKPGSGNKSDEGGKTLSLREKMTKNWKDFTPQLPIENPFQWPKAVVQMKIKEAVLEGFDQVDTAVSKSVLDKMTPIRIGFKNFEHPNFMPGGVMLAEYKTAHVLGDPTNGMPMEDLSKYTDRVKSAMLINDSLDPNEIPRHTVMTTGIHEFGHAIQDQFFAPTAAESEIKSNFKDYAQFSKDREAMEAEFRTSREEQWTVFIRSMMTEAPDRYDAVSREGLIPKMHDSGMWVGFPGLSENKVVSIYSMRNRQEHWAEIFRAYVEGGRERDRLKRVAPASYKFVKTFVTGGYTG